MELLKSLIQQALRMQWSDYLDILIVAFLVYKVIPMVRTPSTMRIAGAVGAVVLISAVTGWMHLYTINFIVNQFMSVGVLALVILFQPELRRVLERLAGSVQLRTLLGQRKPMAEMDPVISQTVTACEIMSREKVGALIVFARNDRLDEISRKGSQIDAIVSEQLIRNIFFVKAPLHDGAVIIRDSKVAAAACVLPLSDSHLSADLGTRHRAGVGMSEASDAVVVIVSEETGTISVAVDGMLKRHLAPQTLERLLHNELCPDEDEDEEKSLVSRLVQKLRFTEKENSREK